MEQVNESIKLIANVIEQLKNNIKLNLLYYDKLLLDDLSNEIKMLEQAIEKLINIP